MVFFASIHVVVANGVFEPVVDRLNGRNADFEFFADRVIGTSLQKLLRDLQAAAEHNNFTVGEKTVQYLDHVFLILD